MPVITTIAGVPLFSTVQEALAWAIANRLSGYHTHAWQGQTGYMGGVSHTAATQRSTITRPTSPRTTSGSGGGGY